jgi:hypothetical protein
MLGTGSTQAADPSDYLRVPCSLHNVTPVSQEKAVYGPNPTKPSPWGHDRQKTQPPVKTRYFVGMTAKEQLKQTVEGLSEAEAQDALGFIVRRQNKRDALSELLDSAPADDEPTTPEEDEGVREAKGQIARGEVLSADEIRREVA